MLLKYLGVKVSLPIIIGGALLSLTAVSMAVISVSNMWNSHTLEAKSAGAAECVQAVTEQSLKDAQDEAKRLSSLLAGEQERNKQLQSATDLIKKASSETHKQLARLMEEHEQIAKCKPTVPNSVVDDINSPLNITTGSIK